MIYRDVYVFINRFRHTGFDERVIIETFTCGCCYWFAHILHTRFSDSSIVYDPVYNHFVTKIGDKLFDITGDVTDKYNVVEWDSFDDELEKTRIIKQCIMF